MLVQALPSPDDRAARVASDLDTCRQLVMELAQMGMERARLLHKQAVGQPEAETQAEHQANPAPDTSPALERTERGIRRSILLVHHLAKPLPDSAAPPSRVDARKRIIRDVEDRIDRDAGIGGDAERLHTEFLDRLDRPEFDRDLAGRPIAEIVAEICRDLGVEAPEKIFKFKRRSLADLAELDTIAAMPAGSRETLFTAHTEPPQQAVAGAAVAWSDTRGGSDPPHRHPRPP